MSIETPVIVWGSASHARVVSDILRLGGRYTIVGYLDDFAVNGEGQGCTPILGGREQLDMLLARGVKHIIIAVGDGSARLQLAEIAQSRGFTLATAIHPRAIVAEDTIIGAGSVIVAGAIINPGAWLGENVIINTGASVEHECVIEDGAHVSAGVHLGGKTTIGRASWVCIGAIVVDRITVGAGSIVGAGSVVMGDIPPGVVAYGSPARVKRSISNNDAQA
jgi:UDP-N-acetylbacillosamine N-acetyltransferase